MGSHPFNLIIRFALELSALVSASIWGYQQSDNWYRYLWAVGVPVLMAIVWGIFNVPNDPSRSGAAPIVVPGLVRLVIELIFFGLAIWSLNKTGYPRLSLSMGIIVILHYLISYDRIGWLLSQ